LKELGTADNCTIDIKQNARDVLSFFRYMYHEEVITLENVALILPLAHQYDAPGIHAQCQEVLCNATATTADNIVAVQDFPCCLSLHKPHVEMLAKSCRCEHGYVAGECQSRQYCYSNVLPKGCKKFSASSCQLLLKELAPDYVAIFGLLCPLCHFLVLSSLHAKHNHSTSHSHDTHTYAHADRCIYLLHNTSAVGYPKSTFIV